jgi:O-succinylbenzoate synthase
MKASYEKYILKFKRPSGTSRGLLKEKETWFLKLTDKDQFGIGECGMFRGLSVDDRPDFEDRLHELCHLINENQNIPPDFLKEFPAIQMGYETALLSFNAKNTFELFPSKFTRGEEDIPINGLVWMGDLTFMKEQISEKIAQGFRCIKLKIGALDFENEIELLKGIRSSFSKEKLILRVDANGAFQRSDIMDKLKKLSDLGIHSIEQPIAANQQEVMREVCAITPLPIALDEELIGCFDKADRAALLDKIKPQYIILKPTLLGGFKSCEEWIELAEARSIGWWITSALESNLGLNAIAQWTYNLEPHSFQGLGTGGLFTNNIEASLEVDSGYLKFIPKLNWNLNI